MKSKLLTLVLTALLITGSLSSFSFAADVPPQEVDPQDPVFAKQINESKTVENAEEKAAGKKLFGGSSSYYFGVDVSEHDGANINWANAKNAGVKFAIIRVAFAGWSTGNVFADKYYERNIKQAHKYGIKVGAYIYSQATTKKEAQAEAKYLVDKLKPLKSYIDMPVVWDMESPKTYTYGGKTYKTYWGKKVPSKATNAANWKAFTSIIRNAGYTPMFYSYTYWCSDHMDMSVVKNDDYPFWLAEYTTASSPTKFKNLFGSSYPYDIWQYSSTKSVSGIGSNVDVNRWYSSDLNMYSKEDFKGKAIVNSSNVTESSFKAFWAAVSGATKYVVTLQDETGKTIKSATTTTLSYNFTGLAEKTGYKVYVLAYKDADAGIKSNALSITTKERVPYAESVKISKTNGTSTATVKWGKESQATKYVVQTSTNNQTWKTTATVTSILYKVTGLSNGNGKYVRVIPYRGSEAGTPSNSVFVHGSFKYTVKDSKGTKMLYRIGAVYYSSKGAKAVGKITVTARTIANVNLRAKKSVSSKRITTIPKGKNVTVTEQNTTWDKVTYKKGTKTYKGYVNNNWLKK